MRSLPTPWLLIALTAVYFAAGKLGLSFATLNSSASAVWPPTGIALTAFLLFGNRVWPAIFAGAFLVNATTAGTILTSVGIAAGNTAEGLVGAYLVTRYASGAGCFERARDVFRFGGLAAVAATAISATIGVTVLALAGFAKWSQFGSIWLTWWLGDAVGALIVTPLLLLWATPLLAFPRERIDEAWLAMLAVVAVAAGCFLAPGLRDYPLAFLCLAPLAWIALRIGPREVATAIVLLAMIAVIATEKGLGPFVMDSRNESLLVLQAFMGMVALTLLPMAAIVREHREAVREAESATRTRDIFLAMLSHELRNPLQAISTSLELLAIPGVSRDNADRAVAICRRQSDHLARLLGDLLDVTRAVSGKLALETRRVRLDEVANRSVDVLRSVGRLDERNVTVDAVPIAVKADAVRLEQIIDNLLANAIKFTPSGGAIRIIVLQEEDKAVLRVQDEGIGIAPAILPKVFDLFMQGERKLEKSQGGLGIGLTLVRTLTELHGGTVHAMSAGVGEGSEFIVRLPLLDEPSGPAMRRPVAKMNSLAYRILIIEDNADGRESLAAVLALDGHEVQTAADGATGMELAARMQPDVVLIDIGMPGMDGYEVARRLREKEALLGVKWRLIAVTGYGQPEDIRRAKAAGFDEHLVKPVLPQALQAALTRPQESKVSPQVTV